MLRLVSTLAFATALVGTATAQQKPWQPFPFEQVSHYKDNNVVSNARYFFTLSADSQTVYGNDTIIYLNRKAFDGEPLCIQPGSELWNEPFIPIYYPFVRDSFRVSNDTSWFNGASLYSDAWNFNVPMLQPMNLSGDGFFVWDSTWYDLDIQDSVRRITLFASLSPGLLVKKDTMRISKTHGLVKVSMFGNSVAPAYASSVDLRLCGFLTATSQWGFETPDVQRYVDYYPGDIMKWHYHTEDGTGTVDHYYRDSVTSVVSDPEFVTVNVSQKKQIYNDGIFMSETQQETFLSFDMGALRLQSKRTSSFMSVDTSEGSNPRPYEIMLYEPFDSSCASDTVMARFAIGLFYVAGGCEVGIVTDDYHSQYFSTKRGLIRSTYSGLAYSETNQVGYHSPTKGISCGDFLPLGVNDLVNAQAISIYPNPTNDKLTINFHQPVSGAMQIVDATGRIIKTQQLKSNALMDLDVSDLTPAVYFIRVLSHNDVYISKFVKQ